MATASKTPAVKVGLIDISFLQANNVYEKALGLIAKYRADKAMQLKQTADKYRCVAAGVLLNAMLRLGDELYDDRINIIDGLEALRDYDENYNYEVAFKCNGKPYFLNHEEIHYNISHSKDIVVCAIGDKDVGIDVEGFRDSVIKIARRFYSKEELKWVEDASCDSKAEAAQTIKRATRLWTLKEAYSKYTGQGIAYGIKNAIFEIKGDCIEKNDVIIQEYEHDSCCISVVMKNL